MNLKLLPLLGIMAVLLISGCVQTLDPSEIAKTTTAVKEFLEAYPNAEVTASYLGKDYVESIITNLRGICGEQMKIQDYWKVDFKDDDTGANITVWIETEKRNAVCFHKEGKPIAPGEEMEGETPEEIDVGREPDLCGDGFCGEEEDCVQDCSTELSLGIVALECTSAAGGFFNAIIDLGKLDKDIFDMTVEDVGEKFTCKSVQTDYGCVVDIQLEDIIIEVGRTDVSGNWILANTRIPGTLQKHIFGPGNWTLSGARYQNEGKHIFLYLHFAKETHPTNKKCYIGDTWLETANENTRNFYKCCYDYDGGEREVKIYIKIPETNRYIYADKMLHGHRLTLGPSKPEMIEEGIPIEVQVQGIHGYYDEGPAGFTGYVICVDIEDEAVDGDIWIYIDDLKYVHTGEGIGSYYGICEDESFGIYQAGPWGYTGSHKVRINVVFGDREGEDVSFIDFASKTVTKFAVERKEESCGPFCTNYTYRIVATSGYSPPLQTSYDPEYGIGGSKVRIIQNDGKKIDLETYDYCACHTFDVIPVCTGPGGISCTARPAQFEKVIYDGNIIEEGYCKSTETGVKVCFDNITSVSIEY